jgi:interferon gamma-inducible protein 30
MRWSNAKSTIVQLFAMMRVIVVACYCRILLLCTSVVLALENSLLRKQTQSTTISANDGSNIISPRRIKVQLYDEALCIGCQNFVTTQLVPTFNVLGSAVIDLEVVPFGNAKITNATSREMECQHGPAECDANSFEQCAADIYPYASRYLPFVDCLYRALPMGHREALFDRSIFAKCAQEAALQWDSISDCHDDPERSWKLQMQAYKQTPSDHQYVPWVVIDGKTMDMNEEFDLHGYVCQAYVSSGGHHPACADKAKNEFLRVERD